MDAIILGLGDYEFEVRWYAYEGEYRSRVDFERVDHRQWLGKASVFRVMNRLDQTKWYIALVGPSENLDKAERRLKRRKGRSGEPEEGMNDGVAARHIRHFGIALEEGKPIGRRHYVAGAELDSKGGMHPRRWQG